MKNGEQKPESLYDNIPNIEENLAGEENAEA